MVSIVAAVIGAGASYLISKDASRKAANTAEDASKLANQTQWDMYKQSRADEKPWLEAGTQALNDLKKLQEQGPGDFKSSEYYNQGLDEANRAIDTYNASRGLYASGKAAKDLARTAVELNKANRTNWLNEWISTKLNPTQSLANVGQSAAINSANATTNLGNALAGNIMDAGQTRATGQINAANNTIGTIQGVGNALGNYYGNKPVVVRPTTTQPVVATTPSPQPQANALDVNTFQPSQVELDPYNYATT